MRIAIIAATIVAIASPTVAGFIRDRSDWNRMGQAQKADYAMGLFDGLGQGVESREGQDVTFQARYRCIAELRLQGADLATLIDEGYAGDASLWSRPPIAILLKQTNRVCRDQINEARAQAGLDLWP